jgi:hypothetical protein
MSINEERHKKHKMPKNSSFDKRKKWHLDHQENCSCRPIPEKLLAKMKNK